MKTLTNEIVSAERLNELFASFADDKQIQEQFGDGDYANESGDIMSIIAEVKSLRAQLAEQGGGQSTQAFAWATVRDGDASFPRLHMLESDADYWVGKCNVSPPVRKIKLFTNPVPQAVSQPVDFNELANRFIQWPVPDNEIPDGTTGRTGTNLLTHRAAVAMLRFVLDGYTPAASQPYTVPDELTERLFHLREQEILDGSYVDTGEWENLAFDALKALSACRAAMIQSAPVCSS
ncbi:hypothetical protein [Symbiopectobacterium sp.]|uniref:hypothetical protein n=1 Tax=Symbiopectobacterium sp. TaxID=2952789 RepID=UPI003F4165BD